MLPVLIGAGVLALFSGLFKDDGKINKKIFISFSVKDEKYRNYLVKQSKKDNSPFTFIDMSVKQPWEDNIWKQKCRTKIRSCDGMIVLLSKNTWHSSGTRWEIKCAKNEGIPIVGMHIKKKEKGAIPPDLKKEKIITWTWSNLESVIKKI